MAPFELTPSMLSSLEVPHELSLSPSGTHVAYTLRSDWNRPHPSSRWVSSLWIAETNRQHSAHQLTSGESNDSWPQFSPDGKIIAFLSDRASEGVPAIWTLDPTHGEDNAVPLTSTDCEKGVAKFAWSGDGKYIAFLSPDEKSAEMKARDERKDDAMVYGAEWGFARLRVVDVATKQVTTLVSDDCHVYDFGWGSDPKQLAYVTTKTPEGESAYISGSSIRIIGLEDQDVTKLADFPAPLQDLCWVAGDLWWRANYDLTNTLSSRSVYKLSVAVKTWNRSGFGEHNCATSWALPPGLRKLSEDSLVVQVQSGLADQFHVLPHGSLLYNELHEVRSWDVVTADDKTLLAVVKSNANTPSEVYSIVEGKTICLSNHGKDLAEMDIAVSEPFYATAQDGTDLDGILVTPKNYDVPKPWPTIVLVHGGPYMRVSQGFDLPFFNWSPWFTSLGYAVLCVNHRGGSSHGESYAAGLRQAAGTTDYSDTIDLVNSGIAKGIIDKDRVGIAGWSYGGYISYLAVTRDPIFHFQAAVCGAGLTDWDLAIMTTDQTLECVQLAGHAPWDIERSNTKNRESSAIWGMPDIKTPVLILHGENDDGVPLSQAKAFYNGCLRRGAPCEMVVYPREGHGMFPPFERQHYIDLLERMKRFFDKHLKTAA